MNYKVTDFSPISWMHFCQEHQCYKWKRIVQGPATDVKCAGLGSNGLHVTALRNQDTKKQSLYSVSYRKKRRNQITDTFGKKLGLLVGLQLKYMIINDE